MIFRPLSRKHLLLATALTLCLSPMAAQAEVASGAYLAAAVAISEQDFAAAVDWSKQALANDPTNQSLLEGLVLAYVGTGDMVNAAKYAQQLADTGSKSQTATIVLIADAAKKSDFEAILKLGASGSSAGTVLDGLVKGWAQLGLGRMSEATAAFDTLAKTKGLEAFGLYHKALALASAGDFEGADAILSGRDSGELVVNRRGALAQIEILSQLERNADAIAFIDRSFIPGRDLQIDALRARLVAGEPLPFTVARNAVDGIAEVFFTMATAVNGDAAPAYTMLHSRAAAYLRPDNTEAILLTANLLEQQKQYDLAVAAYATIKPDDPAFYIAEIGRAEATQAAGRTDASLEILQSLARSHGNQIAVQTALGDGLRRAEKFAEAKAAYDAALALMPTPPEPQSWPLYYSRGVSLERMGDFAAADTDLRQALALNPDEPQILNYLGYSLVDRGQHLDEALGMIQKAVAGRPDSGAILDSLAWAYFRLGRYGDALEPMEKASLLEPVDPVVTDHLGDVYWSVGRTREAEYQWRRALSFNPAEADATRIRQKLDQGLDAVRAAEGATPIMPADVSNGN
ncbi:MAG: tetratricopeptide repeat protein [Cypionkella sp.]